MSSRQVCIESYAALHGAGMLSRAGLVAWQADQRGPEDVRRAQVLPRPLPSFGKLSLPDRLSFAAVSLMLHSGGTAPGEDTAICVALAQGSLSTDLRYCESVAAGAPSPAYFSATLPASAISEIAIQYKLKGPNRVYAAGDGRDWLWALEDGHHMVATGSARQAVVVLTDAIEEQDRASPLVPETLACVANRSLALLLGAGEGPRLHFNATRNGISARRAECTEYFCELLDAVSAAGTVSLTIHTETLMVTREHAGTTHGPVTGRAEEKDYFGTETQ